MTNQNEHSEALFETLQETKIKKQKKRKKTIVTVIPVAALTEDAGKTVVHVKQSNGAPSAGVEVETGKSDGEYVEILTGLTENQPIFYAYYDTPDIDNTA